MGENVDISHLTLSEQKCILEVLQRDEDLKHDFNQRIIRLKAELQWLKKRGALKPSANNNTVIVDPNRNCARCRAELGRIINRGAICRRCQLKICKSCRIYTDGSANHWVCVVCHKHREIEAASGEWMTYFGRTRSTDRSFSTILDDPTCSTDKDDFHRRNWRERVSSSAPVEGANDQGATRSTGTAQLTKSSIRSLSQNSPRRAGLPPVLPDRSVIERIPSPSPPRSVSPSSRDNLPSTSQRAPSISPLTVSPSYKARSRDTSPLSLPRSPQLNSPPLQHTRSPSPAPRSPASRSRSHSSEGPSSPSPLAKKSPSPFENSSNHAFRQKTSPRIFLFPSTKDHRLLSELIDCKTQKNLTVPKNRDDSDSGSSSAATSPSGSNLRLTDYTLPPPSPKTPTSPRTPLSPRLLYDAGDDHHIQSRSASNYSMPSMTELSLDGTTSPIPPPRRRASPLRKQKAVFEPPPTLPHYPRSDSSGKECIKPPEVNIRKLSDVSDSGYGTYNSNTPLSPRSGQQSRQSSKGSSYAPLSKSPTPRTSVQSMGTMDSVSSLSEGEGDRAPSSNIIFRKVTLKKKHQPPEPPTSPPVDEESPNVRSKIGGAQSMPRLDLDDHALTNNYDLKSSISMSTLTTSSSVAASPSSATFPSKLPGPTKKRKLNLTRYFEALTNSVLGNSASLPSILHYHGSYNFKAPPIKSSTEPVVIRHSKTQPQHAITSQPKPNGPIAEVPPKRKFRVGFKKKGPAPKPPTEELADLNSVSKSEVMNPINEDDGSLVDPEVRSVLSIDAPSLSDVSLSIETQSLDTQSELNLNLGKMIPESDDYKLVFISSSGSSKSSSLDQLADSMESSVDSAGKDMMPKITTTLRQCDLGDGAIFWEDSDWEFHSNSSECSWTETTSDIVFFDKNVLSGRNLITKKSLSLECLPSIATLNDFSPTRSLEEMECSNQTMSLRIDNNGMCVDTTKKINTVDNYCASRPELDVGGASVVNRSPVLHSQSTTCTDQFDVPSPDTPAVVFSSSSVDSTDHLKSSSDCDLKAVNTEKCDESESIVHVLHQLEEKEKVHNGDYVTSLPLHSNMPCVQPELCSDSVEDDNCLLHFVDLVLQDEEESPANASGEPYFDHSSNDSPDDSSCSSDEEVSYDVYDHEHRDYSLPTIMEESCEESEMSRSASPVVEEDPSELEKYFNFAISENTFLGRGHSKTRPRSFISESGTELSDNVSEISTSSSCHDLENADLDAAHLAASRLENYFMSGLVDLNDERHSYPDDVEFIMTDDGGDVTSDGEDLSSAVSSRRSSIDGFKVSGNMATLVRTGSQSSSENDAPFERSEGFDTVKRRKKNSRALPPSQSSSVICDDVIVSPKNCDDVVPLVDADVISTVEQIVNYVCDETELVPKVSSEVLQQNNAINKHRISSVSSTCDKICEMTLNDALSEVLQHRQDLKVREDFALNMVNSIVPITVQHVTNIEKFSLALSSNIVQTVILTNEYANQLTELVLNEAYTKALRCLPSKECIYLDEYDLTFLYNGDVMSRPQVNEDVLNVVNYDLSFLYNDDVISNPKLNEDDLNVVNYDLSFLYNDDVISRPEVEEVVLNVVNYLCDEVCAAEVLTDETKCSVTSDDETMYIFNQVLSHISGMTSGSAKDDDEAHGFNFLESQIKQLMETVSPLASVAGSITSEDVSSCTSSTLETSSVSSDYGSDTDTLESSDVEDCPTPENCATPTPTEDPYFDGSLQCSSEAMEIYQQVMSSLSKIRNVESQPIAPQDKTTANDYIKNQIKMLMLSVSGSGASSSASTPEMKRSIIPGSSHCSELDSELVSGMKIKKGPRSVDSRSSQDTRAETCSETCSLVSTSSISFEVEDSEGTNESDDPKPSECDVILSVIDDLAKEGKDVLASDNDHSLFSMYGYSNMESGAGLSYPPEDSRTALLQRYGSEPPNQTQSGYYARKVDRKESYELALRAKAGLEAHNSNESLSDIPEESENSQSDDDDGEENKRLSVIWADEVPNKLKDSIRDSTTSLSSKDSRNTRDSSTSLSSSKESFVTVISPTDPPPGRRYLSKSDSHSYPALPVSRKYIPEHEMQRNHPIKSHSTFQINSDGSAKPRRRARKTGAVKQALSDLISPQHHKKHSTQMWVESLHLNQKDIIDENTDAKLLGAKEKASSENNLLAAVSSDTSPVIATKSTGHIPDLEKAKQGFRDTGYYSLKSSGESIPSIGISSSSASSMSDHISSPMRTSPHEVGAAISMHNISGTCKSFSSTLPSPKLLSCSESFSSPNIPADVYGAGSSKSSTLPVKSRLTKYGPPNTRSSHRAFMSAAGIVGRLKSSLFRSHDGSKSNHGSKLGLSALANDDSNAAEGSLPQISVSDYTEQKSHGIPGQDEDIEQAFTVYQHRSRTSLSSYGARSESMNSVYSAAGGGRYGTVTVTGDIQFKLSYNYKAGAMEIHIIECRDLAAVDAKRNRSDPYVKAYLLPDKTKSGKRKTKVKKHTVNPHFDEVLKFHVTISELETRTLWLTVWHSDMFGRNDFLGEVLVPLGYEILDKQQAKWYSLQERVEPNDSPKAYKGDLIISLKFTPHSTSQKKSKKSEFANLKGQLALTVREARNLMATRANGTSDPFCKSYLLPEKSKVYKQKTPVIKKNCNPNWNHTFRYDNVTLNELKERCLELTIWDYDKITSNDFLGGVRLSLGSGKYKDRDVDWMDSQDEELRIWQEMIDRPNQWIDGSLVLRPSMQKQT